MDENATNTPQGTDPVPASGSQVQEQQTGGVGGSPAAQQSQGEQNNPVHGGEKSEDGSVYSENNSFKLVVDPRTGRRSVVMNDVQKQDDTEPAAQGAENNQNGTQEPLAEAGKESDASDSEKGTEQQPEGNSAADTSGLVSGIVGTENAAQSKEYTPQELSLALQLGQVDENRIPVSLRQQYYAYKAQQGNPTDGSAPTDQASVSSDPKDEDIASYYGKIDTIAKQLALKDLGLTPEELETAEYSDDKTLAKKVELYKVAVESNRNKIILDIERERGKTQLQQQEIDRTFNEVKSFVEKVQKEEPHFTEIDKLMATRAMELPYAKAAAIVPVLQRLAQHKTTREDIPVLQQYYDDTRMEYYSRINNVKRAPEIVKPPVVEQPGTGQELPTQKPDLSKLGNLPYKEKIKAIGQLFKK